MTITPNYHDIFDGPKPKIEELLSGVPSVVIMHLMSMLNAEIFSRRPGKELQLRLFQLMSMRFPSELAQQILTNAQRRVDQNNGEEIAFFSTIYNLEFIHYELTNFREGSIENINPDQDLNILKAYFLIIEQISNVYTSSLITGLKLDQVYFYKMVWPTLLEQFEVNLKVNTFTAMVKSLAFFIQMEYQTPYKETVSAFLKRSDNSTSSDYIRSILSVMLTSQEVKHAGGFEFANYAIPNEPGLNTLLDIFCIDQGTYSANYSKNNSNYLGIRDKPLYKSGKEGYLVLNWNFLSNKLYDGLLFDFYRNSGINAHNQFKKLPNFKQFVSEQVTEGYLFRKLLTVLFGPHGGSLGFDERKQIDNHPDCYFRKGNDVLLIEIKDAYFPSGSVSSISYDTIVEAINNKYNNDEKGKGLPQIIKQLQIMLNGSFEPGGKSLDTQELNIYPVMVYTDGNFNLPGINDYLGNELELKLRQADLTRHYKTIRPLTFININFFIEHLSALEMMDKNLFSLINAYHQQIASLKSKFYLNTEDEVAFFDQYNPFEKIIYWLFTEDFKRLGGYMASIQRIIGLLEDDAQQWKANAV